MNYLDKANELRKQRLEASVAETTRYDKYRKEKKAKKINAKLEKENK